MELITNRSINELRIVGRWCDASVKGVYRVTVGESSRKYWVNVGVSLDNWALVNYELLMNELRIEGSVRC